MWYRDTYRGIAGIAQHYSRLSVCFITYYQRAPTEQFTSKLLQIFMYVPTVEICQDGGKIERPHDLSRFATSRNLKHYCHLVSGIITFMFVENVISSSLLIKQKKTSHGESLILPAGCPQRKRQYLDYSWVNFQGFASPPARATCCPD